MPTWITHHVASERMPRHRHWEPYAALILAGGYTEAGDSGRIRVQPAGSDAVDFRMDEVAEVEFSTDTSTPIESNLPTPAVDPRRLPVMAEYYPDKEMKGLLLKRMEPLFADSYETSRDTGSFILIDPATRLTVAAGMVRDVAPA